MQILLKVSIHFLLNQLSHQHTSVLINQQCMRWRFESHNFCMTTIQIRQGTLAVMAVLEAVVWVAIQRLRHSPNSGKLLHIYTRPHMHSQ